MLRSRQSFPTAVEEMDRLQQEMERLFMTVNTNPLVGNPGYPAVNIWVGEDGVVVSAEIPGVNSEDVDINVVGEALTIRGERKHELLNEDFKYHRQERGYGKFARSIQLPFPVDVARVNANLVNGILKVDLPRAEEDKPRKITVRGGSQN